jgi:predicted DNA-binding WGR domain protein
MTPFISGASKTPPQARARSAQLLHQMNTIAKYNIVIASPGSMSGVISMPTFEFREGKSAKFWSIELQGKSYTVRYGKIGTIGQTQTKKFSDAAQAKKEHDNLVAEKVKKGYVETTSGAAQPRRKLSRERGDIAAREQPV